MLRLWSGISTPPGAKVLLIPMTEKLMLSVHLKRVQLSCPLPHSGRPLLDEKDRVVTVKNTLDG